MQLPLQWSVDTHLQAVPDPALLQLGLIPQPSVKRLPELLAQSDLNGCLHQDQLEK